jgi:hypothetical protein
VVWVISGGFPPVFGFGVRAAMILARDFSRQHRIIHFASIGSASGLRICELRICLQLSLHPYPRSTNAWAGLPSCVIPLLDYYQRGSGESGTPPEGIVPFRPLATLDSSWANQSGYGNINPFRVSRCLCYVFTQARASITSLRLSHSEIYGSKRACRYP